MQARLLVILRRRSAARRRPSVLDSAATRSADPAAYICARRRSLPSPLIERHLGARIDQLDEAGRLTPQHFDLAFSSSVSDRLHASREHVVAITTPLPRSTISPPRRSHLTPFDVVFRADADRAQMRLRAHHVLHRRNELLRQAAVVTRTMPIMIVSVCGRT